MKENDAHLQPQKGHQTEKITNDLWNHLKLS